MRYSYRRLAKPAAASPIPRSAPTEATSPGARYGRAAMQAWSSAYRRRTDLLRPFNGRGGRLPALGRFPLDRVGSVLMRKGDAFEA